MSDDILTITPGLLADGAVALPLLSDGAAVDTAIVAVDLDIAVDAATCARAVAAARASDRVLVGFTRDGVDSLPMVELAAALDTTVVPPQPGPVERCAIAVPDVEAALRELHRAVRENPHASLALSQVLRISEHLPVPAAIDVESFAYSTLLGGTEFAHWLTRRGPRPLPPPSPQEPVLVRREHDQLLVTLNRPERRNAYGAQVRDGLVEALRLAEADDTIVTVVLDGAGLAFSAGGDLDEFGTTPDLATAHLIRTRAGAGRFVASLADRIVVHVHGSCVGAGIEVPAFAGRVVADPGSVFRLPEVAMGLVPGAGGTVSLPRRIGRWRTFWLCLTGVALDAPTALEWGLVDATSVRDQ